MTSRTSLMIILAGVVLLRSHEVKADDNDTLELLHVLVRHGNRTSISTFTQFIPEYIENFGPFGFGLLTPRGREQMAKVGQFLRDRYDDFLPDEFSYGAVSVNCSAMTRVKESAMVTMATMFPPKNVQQWGDSDLGMNWTPISCQNIPMGQDMMYDPSFADCPRYSDLRQNVYSAAKFQAKYNELTNNGALVEYIQRSLNMSTNETLSYDNVKNVWENLRVLESMEMPLPEWSKALYPNPLTEINHMTFWADYGSTELLMFSVGEYLRAVMDIAQALEDRTLRPLDRKLYISFGHDSNIMPLLVALNLEDNPPQPDYGAVFIMEMHRVPETQEIGLKFVYRNVTWQDPIVYTVPGCDEICPLWFIQQLVQDVIPPIPIQDLCFCDATD